MAVQSRGSRGGVRTTIGLVIVGVYLFPVYWMIATSFKSQAEIFQSPPSWIPTSPTLESYVSALARNPAILDGLTNSAIISSGTMLLTLLLAAPAAYGLARLRLRYAGLILLPFLISQLLPSINLAVPLFILFTRIGLTNSLFSLVIANTMSVLPFVVIVLRPFFLRVPGELEDAAAVDGCGRFTTFWRIVLPLVRPGLVTVAAFAFILTWGEFTLGLTLATDTAVQPVTVALNQFIGQFGTAWGPLMAASTVVALPIIVIFATLQRYITGGLSAGALK